MSTDLATVDDRGLPPGGSAAEGRRGSIDDRGLPPGGSAAEGRRGSIDDRGLPPGGSAAEGRRGSIDDRGLPPGGSAAEGRRGSIDDAPILIVDDHDANLLALEVVLGPLGHPLVRATSGKEALRQVLDREFAVILLDVAMPDLDGFETATLIRNRERSRGIPIIFISARVNRPSDVLQGYTHGAVDYLVKPFDPDILKAKVDVFVELYRSRREIQRQAAALRERDLEHERLERSLLQSRHERERAEAAAATYGFVAESIPQQVWTATPDGALDYVNSVVRRYFDQTSEAILGAGWQAVIHPDDVAACIASWTASLTTGAAYEVEFRLRRHDACYRWHLGRALPERDPAGTIVRWFGTNTDIDDRKAVEVELRRAAELSRKLAVEEAARQMLARDVRYSSLRADIGTALANTDSLVDTLRASAEAVVRHLDAAFARIWTLNAEAQILELVASAGMYTHVDGAHARVPVGQLKIGRIAEDRVPHLTNDVAHDPRIGDPAWAAEHQLVAFAGYPLMVDGACTGVIAMFSRAALTDDTLAALAAVADVIAQGVQRKRAEDALELRAQELARSNAELERFAYVASHDLQEPLRMVASYTQLLGRRYAGKLDANADDFIRFAVDGANRMQALINDLLAFSRVTTQAKQPAEISLEVPLAGALANLQVAITTAEATVLHDPLPALKVDHQQFLQLFQNLIGNAIKFKAAAPPVIQIRVRRDGPDWVISVSDNGIGISDEFFDRLFVLFQRLHTRSEYPGNGIGLAICKKIVERHGGRIWVESAPGRGATFSFQLRGTP
jgi:PAS domain S-box-containing protein